MSFTTFNGSPQTVCLYMFAVKEGVILALNLTANNALPPPTFYMCYSREGVHYGSNKTTGSDKQSAHGTNCGFFCADRVTPEISSFSSAFNIRVTKNPGGYNSKTDKKD